MKTAQDQQIREWALQRLRCNGDQRAVAYLETLRQDAALEKAQVQRIDGVIQSIRNRLYKRDLISFIPLPLNNLVKSMRSPAFAGLFFFGFNHNSYGCGISFHCFSGIIF